MASLKVIGGRALSGRVAVEGNKNSALPLIAACMLTDQPCELSNVPRIRDVDVLLDILVSLGATVEGRGTGTLRIQCTDVKSDRPDPALVGRLRGSVLLLGPLLARRGSARLAPPGGDFPTRRTILTHLEALVSLGAEPLDEAGGHGLHAPKGLIGASFYLDEASVTGTETALLAAVAAKGPSEIRHAAMEPHVVELCEFLQAMGAGIEGAGTPRIRVEPPSRLAGASHRLAGDYIEAGSWGVVAAITNGSIEVTGARTQDLEVIAAPLKRMGLQCSYDDDTL
jgi:UDP-N-acetylglucosamine 1-carboxyvinyltransferase